MRFLKVSAIAASVMAISMMEPATAQVTVNAPPTTKKELTSTNFEFNGGVAAFGNKVYVGRTGAMESHTFQADGTLNTAVDATVTKYNTNGGSGAFSGAGIMSAVSNVQAKTFYVCNTNAFGVYRYTVDDDTLTRLAGDSGSDTTVAPATGTGTAGKVLCSTTALQASTLNGDGTALYFFNHGGDQALAKVDVGPTMAADGGTVTNIAFGTAEGSAIGKGTAGTYTNPLAAMYYKTSANAEFIIFTCNEAKAVRYVALAATPADNDVKDTSITKGTEATDGPSGTLGGPATAVGVVPGKNYAGGLVTDATTDKSKFFLLTWSGDVDDFRIDFDPADRGVKSISAGAMLEMTNTDVYLIAGAATGEKLVSHMAFDAQAQSPSGGGGNNPPSGGSPSGGNTSVTTSSPSDSNNTIDSSFGATMRVLAAACAGALAFSL